MDILFTFILLISLVCFVLGLIQPSWFSFLSKGDITRKRTSLIFFIVIVVSFIGVGVTADTSEKNKLANQKQETKKAKQKNKQTKKETSTKKQPEKEAKKVVEKKEKKSVQEEPETRDSKEPKQEGKNKETEKKEEGKTKEKDQSSRSKLDKLWTALDNSINTRKNFDIKWNSELKQVRLIKEGGDYWDSNDYVRTAYSLLVGYGKEAFKIEGVDTVQIVLKSTFTDKYGKKSEEVAVRLTIEEGEFQKYNWENLKTFKSVYSQMIEATETHYVHPAIFKNVNTNDLYLTDY
jgi:flagellar biosynthesis GTPase FlhF